MFKSDATDPLPTRDRILRVALDMFRERGVDAVTMREISKVAEVALGSAYYYFPSKEAIVSAYYEHVQDAHHALVLSQALKTPVLAERMKILFHSKFDVIQQDKKLLGTIFKYAGEPEHPLSVLGPGTRNLQERGLDTIRLILKDQKIPADTEKLLVLGLWALQMVFIMHFIYDETENQQVTREMIDQTLDLVAQVLNLSTFPMLKPMIQPFLEQVMAIVQKTQVGPSVNG
ncbi:TetR/AcrR family transcriptional regulator [Deinococcus roseus]|uniref:TetR family transcriptional regulator n=1 Tax=Deinococcus roseus TaxID=392414 RepID=A0ABQ2D6M7_9DEIO|nr:TetR/AcrR family transcriptional regulator [Deinococcus roseus]GGJ45866.1 TetR family transcriptional regulator [Deinococcus roseus]